MSVLLPTDPAPAEATPSYLDWGGTLRPIFGGALQKLRRLGDRFALSVNMPPMLSAEDGMTWVARLITARGEGAILPWPQPGFDPGAPGAPKVVTVRACVSPRVKSPVPCVLGSTPTCDVIGRISSSFRPSGRVFSFKIFSCSISSDNSSIT